MNKICCVSAIVGSTATQKEAIDARIESAEHIALSISMGVGGTMQLFASKYTHLGEVDVEIVDSRHPGPSPGTDVRVAQLNLPHVNARAETAN